MTTLTLIHQDRTLLDDNERLAHMIDEVLNTAQQAGAGNLAEFLAHKVAVDELDVWLEAVCVDALNRLHAVTTLAPVAVATGKRAGVPNIDFDRAVGDVIAQANLADRRRRQAGTIGSAIRIARSRR